MLGASCRQEVLGNPGAEGCVAAMWPSKAVRRSHSGGAVCPGGLSRGQGRKERKATEWDKIEVAIGINSLVNFLMSCIPSCLFYFIFICLFSETGSHYVAYTGLEHAVLLHPPRRGLLDPCKRMLWVPPSHQPTLRGFKK